MDWSHWQVEGGEDVGQQGRGLNFSDPGLLLEAACEGLGIALVSQLLAQRAVAEGQLQALSQQRVRGPAWACLVHRDSQDDPLARQFLAWLRGELAD
jgi:LysR family glycine cleavage system transcriptional activator